MKNDSPEQPQWMGSVDTRDLSDKQLQAILNDANLGTRDIFLHAAHSLRAPRAAHSGNTGEFRRLNFEELDRDTNQWENL